MVTQSEIQRMQRQQFAQAQISSEDVYSRMQKRNEALNIQRQQQYEKALSTYNQKMAEYQKSIDNYVNSMKAQGINLKPIYADDNLTGFEDIDKGMSIPLSNIDRYLATKPFMPTIKPFSFKEYAKEYPTRAQLQSIQNPPKPKPNYYQNFKTFVQNTSFDKGVWLKNLPREVRSGAEAYYWKVIGDWSSLLRPKDIEFQNYTKSKLNAVGGERAVKGFIKNVAYAGLSIAAFGIPGTIVGITAEPIVSLAATKARPLFPQNRLGSFLYMGALTSTAAVPIVGTQILGPAYGVAFGKEAISHPAETTWNLISHPEYIAGAIAGGYVGGKVFAPKIKIRPEDINIKVKSPTQKTKITKEMLIDIYGKQIINEIKTEKLSALREYIIDIKNPTTGKLLRFKITEFGKYLSGTNIVEAGTRKLLGRTLNEKGKLIETSVWTVNEQFNIKTNISNLITTAIVNYKSPRRIIGGLSFGSKYRAEKLFIAEDIKVRETQALVGGKMKGKITGVIGKKIYPFKAELSRFLVKTEAEATAKLIKTKLRKISKSEGDIMFSGLLKEQKAQFLRYYFPTGFKIIRVRLQEYALKPFNTLLYDLVSQEGELLPKTISTEIKVSKSFKFNRAISKAGPDTLFYKSGAEIQWFGVGEILGEVLLKKIKKISQKKTSFEWLTPEERATINLAFNKLKITFTKDNFNNYFGNTRKNEALVIIENQVATKSGRPQELVSEYYGKGTYERTPSEMMYSKQPMAKATLRGTVAEMATQQFILSRPVFNLSDFRVLSYINPAIIKSNQQFLQNVVSTNKFSSSQINRLVELNLVKLREAELLKQPQIQKFVQKQIQKQLQQQKLIQKQLLQPQRPILTAFLTPTIPRVPIIPFPITEERKRKQMIKQKQAYEVWVKEPRSRTQKKLKSAIRLPIPPMPRQNALNLLAFDIDNTVARSGFIKKVKRKPQIPRILIPNLYFNMNIDKFRFHRVRKGKKYPIKGMIEKTKNIIDTRGEKRQLKSYKLISNLRQQRRLPNLF